MKTLQEKSVGAAWVRLLQQGDGYVGAVFVDNELESRFDGEDPDAVFAEAVAAALRTSGAYVGYDGAIQRFLGFFPGGFTDPRYLEQEREYKLAAAARLRDGAALAACVDASEPECAAATHVFGTNMLSRFENARARECLKGPHGQQYLQGAARFTRGERQAGLEAMASALRHYGNASWPLFTFLPYLWAPEEVMFLKPEATLAFATSVGDPFPQTYRAGPHMDTWAALEAMTEKTTRELAGLAPRDRIDVQSFIWVVGNY